MKTPHARTLGLALLALAVVPLASDQAMDPTCNATGSFAGGIADPVNGDEAFFKQVNPGANIMLLIDSSGSMANLPQCGDSDWSTGGSTSLTNACGTPEIPVPTTPANTVVAAVNGSCLPATDTNTAALGCLSGGSAAGCTGLKWMESVVPQVDYADKGNGGTQSTDDMYDCPPWGNGGTGCTTKCTGDSCLFDPNAYYTANGWKTNAPSRWKTGSTVINAATDEGCYLRDSSGALILDPKDNTSRIELTGCSACMSTHGYYFYTARYYTSYSNSTKVYSSATTRGPVEIFRGTFLNANPPKVVTARQVVKKLLWMTQDTSLGKFDQVRFGLTKFNGDSTAGLLVSGVVPTLTVLNAGYNKASYRSARNPMVQALNNASTSFASGSTPVGKALLNIGQYFSQQASSNPTNKSYFAYTSASSPTKASWADTKYTNSSFVPVDDDHCAVCFPSCQKNSVIIMTDGSPNETEGNSNFPDNILTNTTIAADYVTWCPKTCNAAGVPGMGTTRCCQDVAGGDPTVPRVADWLNRYNLWPTKSASSAVTLTTYAIGFGLAPGDSQNTLNAIGKMGGGE